MDRCRPWTCYARSGTAPARGCSTELTGLTDEEYRWEPVADCWNVRPDPAAPGGWTVDYPDVAPDPPPFTTIAWRLVHISDGNSIYWEHGVRSRRAYLCRPRAAR